MVHKFGGLKAGRMKNGRHDMLCACHRRVTITVAMVRAGKMPTMCGLCEGKQRAAQAASNPSDAASGQPEQETPVGASQGPGIPVVVALSACACPVVALCRHCDALTEGEVIRCRVCRLPVRSQPLHGVGCHVIGIFSQVGSQRGQSVMTNQAGYHRGRGGAE